MTLKADVGATDSNAYCSLVEANDYHSTRGFNSAWTNETDDGKKEMSIIWATRLIDAHFMQQFIGRRASWTQALCWPRWYSGDLNSSLFIDGMPINGQIIPKPLKDAVAEFAFFLLSEDWSAGQGSMVDEGMVLGNLHLTKEHHNPIPSSVRVLLSSIITGSEIELVRG
jgi:hypothetical protein